jgi:hypothetical protein
MRFQSLWEDCKYRNRRYWWDFLNWEHTARRRTTATTPSSRGRRTRSPSPPPPSPADEEDEDDENYHIVTEAVGLAPAPSTVRRLTTRFRRDVTHVYASILPAAMHAFS